MATTDQAASDRLARLFGPRRPPHSAMDTWTVLDRRTA